MLRFVATCVCAALAGLVVAPRDQARADDARDAAGCTQNAGAQTTVRTRPCSRPVERLRLRLRTPQSSPFAQLPAVNTFAAAPPDHEIRIRLHDGGTQPAGR